eukprot:CAMPEP_0114512348 /NCGR_PEP_ID=MMETSP0109-20121206/14925_1 /TAXON_ID=29199 /ORGANISM="Chlorarachnion reptans, Strain CCCM449" /LENGTH=491 /DNA_ID=CAMNT_0001692021 /DNA_START=106 /DNA_END=1581 /DNA_ORIENTATION=+
MALPSRHLPLLLFSTLMATATAIEKKDIPDHTQIDTVTWDGQGDFRQFLRNTAKTSKPVVIENSPTSSWGVSQWTPEYLSETIGGLKVPMKTLKKPVFHMGCCLLERIPVRDVIKRSQNASETGDYIYYSGPTTLLGKWGAKQLNLHIFDLKEVKRSENIPEDEILKGNLWIGSQGVVTPAHFDEMHNFFMQVHGTKTFTLLPPTAWAALRLYPKFHHQHRNVRLDLENEKIMKKLLSSSKLGAKTVTLGKGQILYVPPLWFHRVETKSPVSISINIWSASRMVGQIGNAWNDPIPSNGKWGFFKTFGVLAAFLRRLIVAVIPESKPCIKFLQKLHLNRYEHLKRYGKDITSASPIDVHPDAQEIKEHKDYLDQVNKEAPSFLESANIKKPDLKSWCSIDAEYENEAKRFVGPVARRFARLERGAIEIYLGNYIEDLAAQLVGFKKITDFFAPCLVDPLLGDKGDKPRLLIQNDAEDVQEAAEWLKIYDRA